MKPNTLRTSRFAALTIGVAMCLFAGTSAAQLSEPQRSDLRISGFGTVGVVHSQAPAGWGFLRRIEQPASTRNPRLDVDSRLGIQLNYAATSEIELVGQLLASRRKPDTPVGDVVEWAFVAYRPSADLAFRAGRLNLDQFLMSDYRNVGFGYLYARPPVEYYGSVPSYLDGVDLTRTWIVDDAHWRAKTFVGRSKTDGIALNNVIGFALGRESNGLLVRAGWSRARLGHNRTELTPLLDGLDQLQALPVPSVAAQAAALRNGLDLAADPVIYATLGLTYEQPQWQYAAELTRISLSSTNIVAGYASVGRRIGDFTVYGIVSGANTGASAVPTPAWAAVLTPVIGPAAAQQAQALGAGAAYAASQSIRQTTYSLGVRWDIHPRMALKVQWDHVKVKANGGFLWSDSNGAPGRANVATVLLDFVF